MRIDVRRSSDLDTVGNPRVIDPYVHVHLSFVGSGFVASSHLSPDEADALATKLVENAAQCRKARELNADAAKGGAL